MTIVDLEAEYKKEIVRSIEAVQRSWANGGSETFDESLPSFTEWLDERGDEIKRMILWEMADYES